MVVYYPFDGNVEDYGPNKVELSVYGNPEPAKDRFGNFNSAYYFDGETDFMMGNSSIFPTGNQSFTVSLWFNSDDVGSNNGNARQLFGYGGPSLSMLFDNPALPSQIVSRYQVDSTAWEKIIDLERNIHTIDKP